MKNQIDSHTLKVLEFDKVIDLLIKFTTSELGKHACQNITPQTELSLIRKALREVTEMKSLIGVYGLFPFGDLKDITPVIKKAEPKDSFLTPSELWNVLTLIKISHAVKAFLKNDKGKYPAIEALINKIEILTPLEKEISVAVDSEGEILDSASKELKAIRLKIKRVKNQIKSLLEDILNHQEYALCIQEKFITIRHDRYVIPVKAEFKTQFPGVVHDQSKNRATYFIEPFKVVELNNELILLKDEEKREEIRILRKLTTQVREKKEHLIENQRYLGQLDSIQARARMSESMEAQEPELVNQKEINLYQACHPILLLKTSSTEGDDSLPLFDHSKVVPVDLLFPAKSYALIITGANMGGKTAALKTLGLLTLMVQAGMHIPVKEGSRLTIWEKIFADIGDEQKLEESISTFSSHIHQLNKILNQANENSLVLLDEVGAGTDPQEGAALVLAIMDELRIRKTKVVVTSHLNLLKGYAASQPDVMNVSVGFDYVTLKPTFKLLYGIPGNSKALETAARLGIDPQILTKAKDYLKEYNRRILVLIDELEKVLQKMTAIKNDFAKLIFSASRYEQVINRLAKNIEKKKEAIYSQIERKARALLREAELELKKIKKLSPSLDREASKQIETEMKVIKRKLIDNLTKPKKTKKELGVLEKGTRVVIGKERKEGEVINVDHQSNKVEILIGDVRLKTSIDELNGIEGIQIDDKQKKKNKIPKVKTTPSKPSGLSLPLNLIGLTVDEAIPMVDKTIDSALLEKKKELRIIHGLGTGRLRQAIHDHLKQQSGIKNFYLGNPLEGGAGITIVELES